MLIILEGPDCAGKTTLAHELVVRLAVDRPDDTVELVHRGPPSRHPLDEYVTPLLDYRPGRGRHVICDRWHLGEVVYPGVLGRPSVFDPAVRRYVELFLRSRGALVVLVDRPDDAIRSCVASRGDHLVDPDRAVAAARRYREIFDDDNFSYEFSVRVTLGDLSRVADIVRSLVTVAASVEADAVPLNPFVTYVGPPRPRYLLLGDVRGGARPTPDPFPAFMPFPATSGHYLLSALPNNVANECGVANACDVDDVETLHVVLGSPKIVTLGVNAARRTEWRYGATPHPQFIRRFANSYRVEYGEVIRRALDEQLSLLSWRPEESWFLDPTRG